MGLKIVYGLGFDEVYRLHCRFGDSVDFGDSGGLEALIGLWF